VQAREDVVQLAGPSRPGARECEAARQSAEQPNPEMRFEQLDLMANGCLRDRQLLRGARKTQVSRCTLEGAQSGQRGQLQADVAGAGHGQLSIHEQNSCMDGDYSFVARRALRYNAVAS
jgi:hypothetical protein